MHEKVLMGSFAHPDDEAFGFAGSLCRYANEGVHTALVCATRGEEGEISDPSLATQDNLGDVREAELREAARLVGVHDVAFMGYRDGTLAQADEEEATGRLVRHIRRVRPQVIVTFDTKGGYGHPDHIAIHRLTLTAFRRAGEPEWYREHLTEGLQPYTPLKLYTLGMPRSAMRRAREAMKGQGLDFRPGGNAATIPLEEMGVPDEEITTVISLDEHEVEAKIRAMLAHRTQMGPDALINRLPPEGVRAWLGTERFVRLVPADGAGGTIEHDLFEGIH